MGNFTFLLLFVCAQTLHGIWSRNPATNTGETMSSFRRLYLRRFNSLVETNKFSPCRHTTPTPPSLSAQNLQMSLRGGGDPAVSNDFTDNSQQVLTDQHQVRLFYVNFPRTIVIFYIATRRWISSSIQRTLLRNGIFTQRNGKKVLFERRNDGGLPPFSRSLQRCWSVSAQIRLKYVGNLMLPNSNATDLQDLSNRKAKKRLRICNNCV